LANHFFQWTLFFLTFVVDILLIFGQASKICFIFDKRWIRVIVNYWICFVIMALWKSLYF